MEFESTEITAQVYETSLYFSQSTRAFLSICFIFSSFYLSFQNKCVSLQHKIREVVSRIRYRTDSPLSPRVLYFLRFEVVCVLNSVEEHFPVFPFFYHNKWVFIRYCDAIVVPVFCIPMPSDSIAFPNQGDRSLIFLEPKHGCGSPPRCHILLVVAKEPPAYKVTDIC